MAWTAGGVVELLADLDRPGGWLLLLDRIRQSYVDLADPTHLEFPYVQLFAGCLGALPAGPIGVVHIGGGAATLARWIEATRPGSTQLILEPHEELVRIVRHRLPCGLEFCIQDGRSGLAEQVSGSADVVVLDAFSGGRVPAELTTVEFFADVQRVLQPAGMLMVNTTDAAEQRYLRRLIAAMAEYFAEIVVHAGPAAFGNVVLVAAASGALPVETILDQDSPLGGTPLALSGQRLVEYLGEAAPLTDRDPMRSPIPPDKTWRVGC